MKKIEKLSSYLQSNGFDTILLKATYLVKFPSGQTMVMDDKQAEELVHFIKQYPHLGPGMIEVLYLNKNQATSGTTPS
ncbi:MAG: hypothetical protein H0Z39_04040 [Peptococcaceae bacterium]|nr:hypothetical protein [Peptococcaceae bacterium]